MDEDYKESEISKIVKRLMDEEGFEFGEAVKEAMEQTKRFESKADGGSIGIEVLFTDKMANGGRVPMVSGGALKSIGSGIMKMFSKGDDAVDLGKQEEIFRSGNITTDFLENVDDKVIKKFVTTRDAKGPGGYGLYDSFDDMPNGLKAAELISRIKNADGGIDYEAAELFIGKKLKGNETVNELISMVVTEKKADGGRVGLFMGGDPLTGQALAIYNSMSAYGAGDQEIADRLQSLGYYDPNASTPDPTPDQGIINQQLNQGDNNQNKELLKTYTKENVSPTSGEMTQQLLTFDEKKGNPAFMGTVPNPEDFPYSGPVQQFSKIGPNLYDVNPEGTITGERTYRTPRTIGDQVYAASQSDGLGSISKKDLYDPSLMSKGITAVQDFFGKFSSPKVKGTLGDRLLKQSQGMTIPSFAAALGKLRSPFNPNSPTYNAALPMQLNFLEATTGKKITGTSDNLNFTDASMIGRDSNSGLLKYGPGSVLAGKNVISGFGSNDYETALEKYLTRMLSYTKPTKFQQAKIKQARDELAALQAKTEQEYIDSGKKAEVAALQKEIDSGKYSGGSNFAQSNQAAVGGGSKAKNKQGQTAAQATKAGTGTSQGYSQHYARGGLATMFTRRR